MVNTFVALIAISSMMYIFGSLYGQAYGISHLGINENDDSQIKRYYTIATLINNRTTNKEIVITLKSQAEKSNPFELKGINNDEKALNSFSTQGLNTHDVNSNSDYAKDTNYKECKSDCPEKSIPVRDEIPFELPSIPFP